MSVHPAFTFGISLALLFGSQANASTLPNLFLAAQCDIMGPFCPAGGTGYDLIGFNDLYDNPLSHPAEYPPSGQGDLIRHVLWQCEDAAVANSGPLADECPDGSEPIRCLDGTRPLFYLEEGPAPLEGQGPGDSSKWMIDLHSGSSPGTCHDSIVSTKPCGGVYNLAHEANLLGKPAKLQSLSSTMAPHRIRGEGIMDSSPPVVPHLFEEWNRVDMDRCMADSYLGAATSLNNPALDAEQMGVDINGDGTDDIIDETYHHGSRMVEALFNQLAAETQEGNDFASATQVMMINYSDGAYWSPIGVDGWRDSYLATGGTARFVFALSDYLAPSPESAYFISSGMTWPFDETTDTTAAYASLEGTLIADSGAFADPLCTPPGALTDYFAVLANYGFGTPPADCGKGQVGAQGRYINFSEDVRNAARLEDWGAPINADCLAVHPDVPAGRPHPDPCADPAHIVRLHLQTPTFFAVHAGSAPVRNTGKIDWVQDTPSGPALGNGRQGKVTFSAREHARQTRFLAQSAWNRPGAQHGGFVDNTMDHWSLAGTHFEELFKLMEADDGIVYTQEEFLNSFMAGGASHQCVDWGHIYILDGAPYAETDINWPWTPGTLQCPQDGIIDPNGVARQSIDFNPPGFCWDPGPNKANGYNSACVAP